MSLARKISLFANFDQGHRRKISKSAKIRWFSTFFSRFSCDQGLNRTKARCYELKTSFYFTSQKTFGSISTTLSGISPPVFAYSKKNSLSQYEYSYSQHVGQLKTNPARKLKLCDGCYDPNCISNGICGMQMKFGNNLTHWKKYWQFEGTWKIY